MQTRVDNQRLKRHSLDSITDLKQVERLIKDIDKSASDPTLKLIDLILHSKRKGIV